MLGYKVEHTWLPPLDGDSQALKAKCALTWGREYRSVFHFLNHILEKKM